MARPFPVRMGERLRTARKAKGLTQEDLAYKVGVTTNYLSAIERDKKLPTLQRLADLAKAVGRRPADLLGPATTPDAWLDQVLTVARTIPKGDRKLTLALLETIATRRS